MTLANGLRWALVGLALAIQTGNALAQDPLAGIDMTSDAFTHAEMTRADIEAAIAALDGPNAKLDLTEKALNGLDLKGLDLRRVILRAARLNKTSLEGANLEGVDLAQAWGIEANFTGANLKHAVLVKAQMIRAHFDNADLSGATATANFAFASLKGARFDQANLSPGKSNVRSMTKIGFQSATLDGASFKGANMVACYMEYASLKHAKLTDALLAGCDLAGANFEGADMTGADIMSADFSSARIAGILHLEDAKNLQGARNMDQAFKTTPDP